MVTGEYLPDDTDETPDAMNVPCCPRSINQRFYEALCTFINFHGYEFVILPRVQSVSFVYANCGQ